MHATASLNNLDLNDDKDNIDSRSCLFIFIVMIQIYLLSVNIKLIYGL
jgi:hypothetical protein